ncbi:MAG TPA: hypothetical protein VGY53_07835, partial [Isosphaeraceae bacterium]|nr:hypothetical protein [Isosphaeraceae bacterium]
MKQTVATLEVQGTSPPCPAGQRSKRHLGRTGPRLAALFVGLCVAGQAALGFDGGSRKGGEPVGADITGATALASHSDMVSVPVPLPSAKALRYYHSGNVLWAIRAVWGLALPALWLCTGASAALAAWAERRTRNSILRTAIYGAG